MNDTIRLLRHRRLSRKPTARGERAPTSPRAFGFGLNVVSCCLVLVTACSQKKPDVSMNNAFPATVYAVAPVLDFSGQGAFDPLQVADLLASELTHFKGLAVIPVNRVAAAMAAEGKFQIESPAHALRVAETVGADAILVAGISEYDPYTPVVGLTLQLYAPARQSLPTYDAVTATRQAKANVVSQMADSQMPIGQVQRTYNALHDETVRAVRAYARPREQMESDYGWKEYLKVQKSFVRFCWHDALVRLMDAQRRRDTVLSSVDETEIE